MAKEALLHNRKKKQWWLIIGITIFLLMSLGSGIGTFDSRYIGESLFGVVDWFAASILYFFFGATIGLCIDYWIAKKSNSKFKLPLWFYSIIGFVIISLITIFISLPVNSSADLLFNLKFPFMYGIFFPGFAYFLLFPKLMTQTSLPKLILDVIYLGVFVTWLKYESKYLVSKSTANKTLLAIIFIVLLVGMINCATRLGIS